MRSVKRFVRDTVKVDSSRLRVPPLEPAFHVVLVEPEIPPQHRKRGPDLRRDHLPPPSGRVRSGSASTTTPCGAPGSITGTWSTSGGTSTSRISSTPTEEPPGRRRWLFTAHAKKSFFDVETTPGDALVFGRESSASRKSSSRRTQKTRWRSPRCGGVRSHNLANAVAIALYEALRRAGALRMR